MLAPSATGTRHAFAVGDLWGNTRQTNQNDCVTMLVVEYRVVRYNCRGLEVELPAELPYGLLPCALRQVVNTVKGKTAGFGL